MKKVFQDRGYLKYILFAAAAFLFLLIFSAPTSPLFPKNYTGDSAIFMLIGKNMTLGERLYLDIFDHKGPVLFFIEAAGYLLGGATGIFILQVIFLTAALIFLFKTARLFVEPRFAYLSLLGFLIVLSYTISGNMSEEFSLVFICAALYLALRYITRENTDKFKLAAAFVCGFCLFTVIFMRLNNAVAICAAALTVLLKLISEKNYKILLFSILFCILGILTASIPTLIYFGINGGFSEMWYASILYNFSYASDGTVKSAGEWLKSFILALPCIFAFIIAVMDLKKNKWRAFLLGGSALLTFCSTFFFRAFAHYYTIGAPVFALATVVLFERLANRSENGLLKLAKRALCGMMAVIICIFAFYSLRSVRSGLAWRFSDSYYYNYNTISKSSEVIPAEERDSVLGYNVSAQFYLIADIIPANRYFITQDWWGGADASILEEVNRFITEDSPAWIVLASSGTDNEVVNKLLAERYVLVQEDSLMKYYRLSR